MTRGVRMHSFAIDVKGGESRRIFSSVTKGEIVGHRFSLMSIWKYSRGGYRAIEEQMEHIGARGAIGGANVANRAIYAIDNRYREHTQLSGAYREPLGVELI